jgi:tellurite methyltransferase
MKPARDKRLEYHRITAAWPPNALLVGVVEDQELPGDNALDLGCGSGRDTAFLLSKGFKVTAVDAEASVRDYLDGLANHELLRFVAADIERFDFGVGEYELINAHFSLPFIPKHALEHVVAAIKGSLRPGGVFVGQLFGNRHRCGAAGIGMTLCSRRQVAALFSDMKLEQLTEIERDGTIADGTPMHWHRFDIVARKA